jgi:hypothetical protein
VNPFGIAMLVLSIGGCFWEVPSKNWPQVLYYTGSAVIWYAVLWMKKG